MFQSTGWILEEQSQEEGQADELVLAYVKHPMAASKAQDKQDTRGGSLLSISELSD
jgi:hypothetical protein